MGGKQTFVTYVGRGGFIVFSTRYQKTSLRYVILPFAYALASCGGGGGNDSASAPVIAAVPPAPAPAPAPPPPGPTPAPPVVRIAGALPGDTLVGLQTCPSGSSLSNGSGHIYNFEADTRAPSDFGIALTYRAVDSYSLIVEGLGSTAFSPADKVSSPKSPYDQFLRGSEFFILKNTTFATLGLDNSFILCFFAVGLKPPSLPQTGTGDYVARADGIAAVGGQNLRLFGTEGRLNVNYATGAASLELTITGRGNPFEDFLSQPATNITVMNATLQLQDGAFAKAAVSGTGGYTGTIIGRLVSNGENTSGSGGAGAVFTFELRNAQGNVVTGAVIAERNLI